MLTIDTRQVKQLERDLKLFNRNALPFATRKTVNDLAWDARREWQGEIRRQLITRNRWTQQSIRVTATRERSIPMQAAVVGSLEGYMRRQEEGGTVVADGKQGHPIATSYSAGQSPGARPRTRLPRRPNRLSAIQLDKRRRRATSRKQRNLIAVKQAAESGRKFVWLDLGRRQGIFRVTGGKRRPKVRMVYDLSRRSVRTPATPTMQPATQATARKLPTIHGQNLLYPLKRHRILGYGRR